MAVSVLPTPLGPTSRKTPIGRRGSVRFGPRRADALGDGVQGVRLADDPLFHPLLQRQDGADFVGDHAAHGNAGPAGDHFGHRPGNRRRPASAGVRPGSASSWPLSSASSLPSCSRSSGESGSGRGCGAAGRLCGPVAQPAAAVPAGGLASGRRSLRRRGGRFQPARGSRGSCPPVPTLPSSGLPDAASSFSASALALRQLVEPLPMVGAGAVLAVEDVDGDRQLLDAAAAVLQRPAEWPYGRSPPAPRPCRAG